MKLNKILYACFLLALLTQKTLADGTKGHTKLWTNAPTSFALSQDKKWNTFLEPQLRFIDDKYKFDQANLYAGMYYQPVEKLNYWLGVYRGYEQLSTGGTTSEYRFWQQIGWVAIDNPAYKLITRNRVEERINFIAGPIAYRWREKFNLYIPTNVPHLSLLIADEIFIQLNQPAWVVDRYFSQNRAYFGISYDINKIHTIETGYLNQYETGSPDQLSNILFLTFISKFT